MRNAILIALAVLSLAVFAAGVATAFAQSTSQPQDNNSVPDPMPGYTYTVVYRQTDGFIVYAEACMPSNGVVCTPVLKPGQSALDITNQPVLVHEFFTDAHNAKLNNWHVDLSTHQLESTSATSTGPLAPLASVTSTVSSALPGMGLFGLAISGTLLWRRTHRQRA